MRMRFTVARVAALSVLIGLLLMSSDAGSQSRPAAKPGGSRAADAPQIDAVLTHAPDVPPPITRRTRRR